MTSPTATKAWKHLAELTREYKAGGQTIKGLFANDPDRGQDYAVSLPRLYFDYSKNSIDSSIRLALLQLAEECGVPSAINALFGGSQVNSTEKRPALHMVLRGHHAKDLEKLVVEVLARMENFVQDLRSGTWLGYTGHPITDVVNIGIGGSHLGPAMVVRALRPFHDGRINIHFLSNVDPSGAKEIFLKLNPASTVFVIASKTFSTLETLQNAQLARNWFLSGDAKQADLGKHFIAVSSNVKAAEEFGILPENVLPMWNWVGGRYSLWSAIGLPIALGLGMEHFRALLAGAHAADEHFRKQTLAHNIPVIMALLNIFYSEFFAAQSQAILPYSQHLELFPAFLQQLCMESLGKGVDLQGKPVVRDTGMIVWGATGTDGQHSFHQLLHQGTRTVPADFIAFANPVYGENLSQHNHLLANCFSQSQALMEGKSGAQAFGELTAAGMSDAEARQLAKHKAIPGNQPSNTFLLDRLDPYSLGMLTAFYEHSVYVQSAVWNINAFDQWGVELGKKLSGPLFDALESVTPDLHFDDSTNQLLGHTRNWRES